VTWPVVLIEAACRSADPSLFDATGGDKALDALSYCERCNVSGPCEDWVRPRKSHFDGVVAGKVWHEGKPVEVGMFDEGV
jgi:hypothetical protein